MKKKFNVIDLFVVIFLCAIVCFLIFKFSHLNANKATMNDAKPITYTLKVQDIMNLTVDALPESGNIFDENGNVIGTVVSKDIVNAQKIKVKSDGQYVKTTIPDKYDVILTIEADAIVKNEGYFINGKKNIGAGSEFKVKAPDVEFLATVIEIVQ